MAKNNENCPFTQVVTTEDECKVAASKIPLGYEKAVTNSNRPAGCYSKEEQIYSLWVAGSESKITF